MNRELLNKYEERGLGYPFIVSKSGEIIISTKGESLKPKINQMATVIFETIGAVGRVEIDTIEMIGDTNGLIMEIEDEKITGSLFTSAEGISVNDLWGLLKELKTEMKVVAVPEEKPRAQLAPDFLSEIKAILKEYLGDFTERVYQNQLKAQRINPNELYEEDARRFVFALGKAAGMIIGPSKGKDLTNKLLTKLK